MNCNPSSSRRCMMEASSASSSTRSLLMTPPRPAMNMMLSIDMGMAECDEDDGEESLFFRTPNNGYVPPAFPLDMAVMRRGASSSGSAAHRSSTTTTPPPRTSAPFFSCESHCDSMMTTTMTDLPLCLERSPSEESQQSTMSMDSAGSTLTTSASLASSSSIPKVRSGRPTHRRTDTFFF